MSQPGGVGSGSKSRRQERAPRSLGGEGGQRQRLGGGGRRGGCVSSELTGTPLLDSPFWRLCDPLDPHPRATRTAYVPASCGRRAMPFSHTAMFVRFLAMGGGGWASSHRGWWSWSRAPGRACGGAMAERTRPSFLALRARPRPQPQLLQEGSSRAPGPRGCLLGALGGLPAPLPRNGVVGLCVKWRFHWGFIFETPDKTGLVWFDGRASTSGPHHPRSRLLGEEKIQEP